MQPYCNHWQTVRAAAVQYSCTAPLYVQYLLTLTVVCGDVWFSNGNPGGPPTSDFQGIAWMWHVPHVQPFYTAVHQLPNAQMLLYFISFVADLANGSTVSTMPPGTHVLG